MVSARVLPSTERGTGWIISSTAFLRTAKFKKKLNHAAVAISMTDSESARSAWMGISVIDLPSETRKGNFNVQQVIRRAIIKLM